MQSYLFFDYKRSKSMNIIGSRIIELDQTFSTNDFASSLILTSKQADGTIVLAEYQTNGKGQGNNVWNSEKGKNLLFSIILFPDFLAPDKQFYLSISICLAIVDTINEYTKGECKIKWPNDILLNNKKIAGILISNTLAKGKIKNSIVGIGLNINQMNFSVDLPNASSLAIESKIEIDKNFIFQTLVKKLNINYGYLLNANYKYLKQKYLSRLYEINVQSWLLFRNGEKVQGVIIGIEDSGKLMVKVNGVLKSYYHGEIRIEF